MTQRKGVKFIGADDKNYDLIISRCNESPVFYFKGRYYRIESTSWNDMGQYVVMFKVSSVKPDLAEHLYYAGKALFRFNAWTALKIATILGLGLIMFQCAATFTQV